MPSLDVAAPPSSEMVAIYRVTSCPPLASSLMPSSSLRAAAAVNAVPNPPNDADVDAEVACNSLLVAATAAAEPLEEEDVLACKGSVGK